MAAYFARPCTLRHVLHALLSALATLPVMAAAQDAPRPLQPSAFFAPANLPEVTLSPSGDKLALVSYKPGTKRILVVLDLDNHGKTMGVLELGDADVEAVRWVNDKRLVFFARIVDKSDRRDDTPMGLYAINADGSGLLQLTKRYGRRRNDEFQLTNEEQAGKAAGFPMVQKKSKVLTVPTPREGQVNEEILMAFVVERDRLEPFWLNTRTREQRPDNFGLEVPILALITDPHGTPRAAVIEEKLRPKTLRRLATTPQWVPFTTDKDEEQPASSIVGVDNRGSIYTLHRPGPDATGALARLDDRDGGMVPTVVADVPGFDFLGSLVTNRSNGETEGIRVEHARQTTIWKTQAMRSLQARVDALLPGMVNEIECSRCGTSDMVALVRSYSDREPGRLRVYRPGAVDPQKQWLDLGPTRTAIDASRMASVAFRRIQARDGRELPVWITRPPALPGPLPAIVLVHGGPWVRGGTWGWHPLQQFLASRGYLVIEPEMRGSDGYGPAHSSAGVKQFGQAMQDDVADALLWAQKTGLAGERACIMGSSYGGYSALMGPIRHPELYRCAVARAAPADLSLTLEGSFWVDDDIDSRAREEFLAKWVGDPKKDAAMIAANSPLKQAARIKVPVLLAYGEADQRVPVQHGKRMRDAMTATGNPPEWVSFPNEQHAGWMLFNEVDYARRVEAFLAKHLPPH